MKKINHQIKNMLAVACVGMGLSACSLDMLPLNDVVLENYWTNESDVQSVVNSCYAALKEGGYVENMLVWSECRSDNTAIGPDAPLALQNLMKGSLKSTNPYCSWSAMYNVINRCNTVLYYAPQVHASDPNYTDSELAANVAECRALRALSYFTLIKTFRDVPFSFEPSKDDTQEFRIPATKFETILDALIKDLEEVKNDVPKQYAASNAIYNTGKITRAAIYSLLAEMYLWRASDYQLTAQEQNEYYRKCIECCDWVINYKLEQVESDRFTTWRGASIMLSENIDKTVMERYGYPLLSETRGTSPNVSAPYAFNAIFGEGNSFESIFEITFHHGSTQESNAAVANMYGGQTSTRTVQWVVANKNLMNDYPKPSDLTYGFAETALFSTCTDFRSVAPFHFSEGNDYPIYKYVVRNLSLKNTTESGTFSYPENTNSYRPYNVPQDINWIVYRLSEIMLFRAEAEIEMAGNLNKIAEEQTEGDDETTEGGDGTEDEMNPEDNGTELVAPAKRKAAVDGSTLATAAELYDDAFNLILAVYQRSNPKAQSTPSVRPTRARYQQHSQFEALLMNERRREFLFEGKRYYDLVRQARREGSTAKYQAALKSKFSEASQAVTIKMSLLDFMYMPISKTQIQVNPSLTQNPAYAEEENVETN